MTPPLTIRSFTNDQYHLDKVFYSNHYRLKGNKDATQRPIVVDIGAHCGYFTFAALALGAKHVHSVEIHPENYLYLQLNTQHPSFEGLVTTYNFGIYTESVVLPFGDPKMKENIYLDYADLNTDLDVIKHRRQVVTLDHFLAQYLTDTVDILKLNTGFAEIDILSGSQTVGQRVRNICLESSEEPANLHDFIKKMKEKGFTDSVFKQVEEENRTLILLSQDKCEKVFNIQ